MALGAVKGYTSWNRYSEEAKNNMGWKVSVSSFFVSGLSVFDYSKQTYEENRNGQSKVECLGIPGRQ